MTTATTEAHEERVQRMMAALRAVEHNLSDGYSDHFGTGNDSDPGKREGVVLGDDEWLKEYTAWFDRRLRAVAEVMIKVYDEEQPK